MVHALLADDREADGLDELGRLDAAITDAAVTDRADSAHVDLGVTIEGRGQFTGNVYKVGAQEVRVGYEYIVKTSEFELTGIITAMTVAE